MYLHWQTQYFKGISLKCLGGGCVETHTLSVWTVDTGVSTVQNNLWMCIKRLKTTHSLWSGNPTSFFSPEEVIIEKHKDWATNFFTSIACKGWKLDNKTSTSRRFNLSYGHWSDVEEDLGKKKNAKCKKNYLNSVWSPLGKKCKIKSLLSCSTFCCYNMIPKTG